MPASATRITVNDIDCLDPYDLYEWAKGNGYDTSRFWGLVNSLWIPRGIEPSRAFLLLTYGVVANSLNRTGANDIKVYESNVNTESGAVTSGGWYLVRATAIFPGINPRDNSVAWLAEFTDARGICALMSGPVTKQYNVRAPDGTFVGGTAETVGNSAKGGQVRGIPKSWQQVLTELWNELPDCMGPPPDFAQAGLPEVPLLFRQDRGEEIDYGSNYSYPENYIFDGVPALQAIGRVLNDCDLTLVPPLAGGFPFRVARLNIAANEVAALTKPATDAITEGRLIDAFEQVFSALPLIPKVVEVHFPLANYQWQEGDETDFCEMDFYRHNAYYKKTIDTAELLPSDPATTPPYLDSPGFPDTVRVLHDSQLAEYTYDNVFGEFYFSNQKFLNTIAYQRTKRYINSVFFGELPARYVYSGLPSSIVAVFTQAAAERPPNGRWSALYIHDLGGRGQSGGLRLELLRYPRLAPSTVNASIYRASVNLDKGSGGGPAWAPWATCRPGDTIGTQGITFPSSEIGAPPALARAGGSFVATPFARFALARPLDTILPGHVGECALLYHNGIEVGKSEWANASDVPYLTDDQPFEEVELDAKQESTAKVVDVFNPHIKTAVTLTTKDTVLLRWDWQFPTNAPTALYRGSWVAVAVNSSGELLEVAEVEATSGEAKLLGIKHPHLAGKRINTQLFCASWELKEGDRVLVWHLNGPEWMVINVCKADTATLDVVTDVRCEVDTIDPETGAVSRKIAVDKVSVTVVSLNDPAAP